MLIILDTTETIFFFALETLLQSLATVAQIMDVMWYRLSEGGVLVSLHTCGYYGRVYPNSFFSAGKKSSWPSLWTVKGWGIITGLKPSRVLQSPLYSWRQKLIEEIDWQRTVVFSFVDIFWPAVLLMRI